MTGYFRCAMVLFATLLFGCVGDVDSASLLRRYVPGEANSVKMADSAKIVIRSPPGAKGKYLDNVKSDLRERWLAYVSDGRNRYKSGGATISFAITPEGRVRDIHDVKHTSNAEFAAMCQRVVKESKFAPPTEDAIKQMKDGELRLTLNFNYLSPAQVPATSSHSKRLGPHR